MLSSFSQIICRSRISLPLLRQRCSFATSSKDDSSSRSKGDTIKKNKKDTNEPTVDASHQSGTKSRKDRTIWETKEQGLDADSRKHQERVPQDAKTKPSNK